MPDGAHVVQTRGWKEFGSVAANLNRWLTALSGIKLPVCGRHNCICARSICGVVQKGANVVHEKRIQQLSDFLLVGKVERSLERDPNTRILVNASDRMN